MIEEAAPDIALSLDRIEIVLGGQPVVRGLSLAVRRGEFLTLLGPSGCGKSSTLKAIAGYLFPSGGTIAIDGRDVTTERPQTRSVGMVFQNYALFPHLTVAENIAFSLRLRRAGRAEIARRVEEMLDLVRLPGLGQRYPRQLSGGQQQRVALARALAFQPRLLLLDEPLSALDRHLREEMQDELKRIQQSLGITTVFVTHDQGEALTLSDRIAIVRDGGIEQLGTPSEIYERPQTRFVAGFVGKMQFLVGTLLHIGGDTGVVRIDGVGDPLPCAVGRGLAAGERCIIGIRPVRIAADGNATGTSAIVRSVRYFGTHVLAEIELAAGITVQGVDHTRRAEVGRTVAVDWSEAGLAAFPAADPGDGQRPA